MATSSSLIGLIQSCEDNTAPSASHISATYKLLAEGSIGSSRMIHELANAFLQHPRDTGIILHFSSVLVDVVLEISSRVLQDHLLRQWCVLAGELADHVPHLQGLLEEMLPVALFNIRQVVQDATADECSDYLKALRKLLSCGCVSDASAVDTGALMDMILGGADEEEKGVIVFQAASLFFEIIGGISPLLQQEYLRGLVGADRYAHLLVCSEGDCSSSRPTFVAETGAVGDTQCLLAPTCDERFYSTPSGKYSVINAGGIKFTLRGDGLTSASVTPRSTELIFTENTLKNVRKISIAVASEVPILLQGTAGSGKSFLIREFAALLGQKESLVELHLDESTDSKSLIGNYTCSDIPGTFVWQPGLITQAVLKGHWLVIEDVDSAPAEIMAALVPLVERRMLYMPNRMEEVRAHPRFRLFGTRTTTAGVSMSVEFGGAVSLAQPDAVAAGRSFLSSWHVLQLSPLSLAEIRSIVVQAYPQLVNPVVDRLLSVYGCMCAGAMRSHAAKVSVPAALLNPSLALTLKAILKVAKRIATRVVFNRDSCFITEKQNEDMLMEVLDVVVGKCRPDSSSSSVASDASTRYMCEMVSSAWGGVLGELVYRLWASSSPQLSVHSGDGRNYMSIGRISVICAAAASETDKKLDSECVFAHASQTLRLLEKVAAAVEVCEPILLVGETGCGKTTSVQQLAQMMGKKLIVLNISLSTDVNELLGGFRPVTMRQMFMPTYEIFLELFQTTFSNVQNTAYLLAVAQIFKRQNWRKLLQSFKKAGADASARFLNVGSGDNNVLAKKWLDFMKTVARYEVNLGRIENGFAFSFVEGLLVDAMRKGHWVLLDEINLASPETLQGLTGILDGLSLCLTERGDIEPVQRDPAFRVFAAMNPPTDVGKRELSPSLRSRFTEIYVDEMLHEGDLREVVMGYISNVAGGNAERIASDVVSIYLRCRELSETVLADTAGGRPRYSLRSLTRALKAALSYMAVGIKPLNRALYESFLLIFATLLDDDGKKLLTDYFQKSLYLKADKQLSQPPTRPGGRSSDASDWVLVKPFWLRAGSIELHDWAAVNDVSKSFLSGTANKEFDTAKKPTKRFVLTPSVDSNIRCLAAAVAAGVAPVLLQGPTSVGKTSMIEYLAARTGHKCVRINNHEHTDVQEYIGGYITNDQGRLVFNDGLLVQALRSGYWIILDELNLAPSDVLEALNRLLDDNKELLIPETGELVHPAPGFALFATQNPPGVYGGRKPLSRAFRNRFIEIHIGDLPLKEIEEIVHRVCGIPKKFSALEVSVMHELQMMRQQSSLFQGKQGALTTRDLIKWGNRKPDSVLAVAIFGYMLLAEKLRSQSERDIIIATLQSVCNVHLDLTSLYKRRLDLKPVPPGAVPTCVDECARLFSNCLQELDVVRGRLSAGQIEVKGVSGVAPTLTVQRMWLLVNQCVDHSEAVLLVGETGSGKTTVCQLLAAHRGQTAHIVNCHQSTETADIIGGLRPVRNREAIFGNACKLIVDIYVIISSNNCFSIELSSMSQTNLIVSTISNAGVSVAELDVVQGVSDDLLKRSIAEINGFVDSLRNISKDTSSSNSGEESPLKRARVENSDVPKSLESVLSDRVAKLTDCWRRYKALFEWQDGPLVIAMKQGDIFVLDEINLADDAVIERLNSVLESGREITLAEKGGENGAETEKIIAHPNFRFMGTMNPGGDFGKRELSPALRSRFTELWVPAVQDKNDLVMIVREMLAHSFRGELVETVAGCIVDFAEWIELAASQMHLNAVKFSVREIVAWVKFISYWACRARDSNLKIDGCDEEHVFVSYVHGAQVLVLDGLGIGSSASSKATVLMLKEMATDRLINSCPVNIRSIIKKSLSIEKNVIREESEDMDVEGTVDSDLPFIQPEIADGIFSLGYFSIPCGTHHSASEQISRSSYVLSARSTVLNMHRVLRALQLPRPILLEGAPGVGKTSLISSLAQLSGHKLVRINLSEHSEISDLLGTDLPKVKKFSEVDENGQNSQNEPEADNDSMSFAWCDGIFLAALKRGDWVLLDELNLAPQSVLEGLNACFDHRGEIYLPEIGKSFKSPSSFRVFCAQNPVMEGGGRKGLPQSFLSRFSRVFVDPMTPEDMTAIALTSFANGSDSSARGLYLQENIPMMIQMITEIQKDLDPSTTSIPEFGRIGSPWEFNLRDVIRWCEIFTSLSENNFGLNELFQKQDFDYNLARSAHLLFTSRMRTTMDREHVAKIFGKIFSQPLAIDLSPAVSLVTASVTGGHSRDAMISVGAAQCNIQQQPVHCILSRPYKACRSSSLQFGRLFGETAVVLENITLCANLQWPVLLIGPPGAGKRRAVRYLAELTGNHLVEFSMTSSVDASDILGSFEQSNMERKLRRILRRMERVVLRLCFAVVLDKVESVSDVIKKQSAIEMVEIWRLITFASKEVVQQDLIRHDRGKELLEHMEALISALWKSQEVVLSNGVAASKTNIGVARKELISIREDFMLFAIQVNSSESAAGFEWIDGILLEAMQLGRWLLFDNVNQCTPSVLDRLNSLLEPNGTILLTENGTGDVIVPHKNFRIFFTMDATNGGEISRAMRNRCVECFCPLPQDLDLLLTDVASSSRLDSVLSSWCFEFFTAFVKSTDSGSSIGHVGCISESNWLEGLQKKSLYRLYNKLKLFVGVMVGNMSAVLPPDMILNLALELMGPLLNQSIAQSYVRTLVSGVNVAGASVVCSGSDIPVRCLLRGNVFNYLPGVVSASVQLVAILADYCKFPITHTGRSGAYIRIGDLTATAMVIACSSNSRLSAESRLFEDFLRTLLTPSKHAVFTNTAGIDIEGLYLSAICNLVKICIHFASRSHIDILFEHLQSPPLLLIWRDRPYLRLWVVTMVSYLRHDTKESSTMDSDFISGAFVSTASVSLRLPKGLLSDLEHARQLIGCDLMQVSGSGLISAKRQIVLATNYSPETVGHFIHLIDSVIVPRLRINLEESRQSLGLDSALMEQRSGMDAAHGGMTLFQLGEAVDLSKLTALDSKVVYLVSSLYSVVKSCSGAMRAMWSIICAEELCKEVYEETLNALTELARRRDILSGIMLAYHCNLASMTSSMFPLEKIVVAVRWLRKGIQICGEAIEKSVQILTFAKINYFKKGAFDLKVSLDKFDRAIDMYWGYQNRLVNANSGRLWCLGGHASVPYLSEDWGTLLFLRSMLEPINVAGLMRSFSDPVAGEGGLASIADNMVVLESRVHNKRQSFEVIRDWLGLYSTYYWQKTRELEDFDLAHRKKGVRRELDIKQLSFIFVELAKATWGETPLLAKDEQPVDPDAKMYTGHQYALISKENESCGENFMTALAELHVIRTLFAILNHMSLLVLKSGVDFDNAVSAKSESDSLSRSYDGILQGLKKMATRAIEVCIRFTFFDTSLLRELQSLVWTVESMLHDFHRITDIEDKLYKWAAFKKIIKSYVVTLDTRLAIFLSRNSSNFLSLVDFSWMSPTLLRSLELLPKSKTNKGHSCTGCNSSALALGGSALLLRPLGLEAVLRMVDFRAIVTSTTAMTLVQEAVSYTKTAGSDYDSKTAEIPVATCADIRSRMQQLFRMFVHCQRRESIVANVVTDKFTKIESKLNESRFLQLSMMSIDAIVCFLDLFESTNIVLTLEIDKGRAFSSHHVDIIELVSQYSSYFKTVLISIEGIRGLHDDDYISNLWTLLLKPLLTFLCGAGSDSGNCSISDLLHYFDYTVGPAEIGEAWVKLGCLRTHFVLSDAPVDPATVSTVKAALLSNASSHQEALVLTEHWSRGLAGNATVSSNLESVSKVISNNRSKVEVLLRSSIQRREPRNNSDNSSLVIFGDAYSVLKNGLENLINVKRLSELMNRSKNLSLILNRNHNISEAMKLSEKAKKLVMDAVNGLKICLEEESNWQSSYIAFQTHVSTTFNEYEDVTSVVLSALENVSFGLRLVAAWRCKAMGSSVADVAVSNLTDSAVLSVVRYPFSSGMSTTAHSSIVLSQINQQVMINLHAALSSFDVLVSRTESFCGDRSKSVCVTALLLQLLSKIDYFVGSNLVGPSKIMRMFRSILKKLHQFQISSEHEKRRKQTEKDSMFKNRVKENTFISDDAEEETRDLRLNFPDHLAEFQNILKPETENDADGDLDEDNESTEMLPEESVGFESETKTSSFDFASVATDISSYHARMVFLHEQFDLSSNGQCWRAISVDQSWSHYKGLDFSAIQELMNSCINRTLTTTKTLHAAINKMTNPQLDLELSGTSLLIMSSTIEQCQISRNIVVPKTSYQAIIGDRADRDLTFLLFQDSKMYRSPISFHVDPCKEEILHAAAPLNRLLKKASALLIDFPGNEVLLQLCKLTARISQFHISTPLGKMLASIELLYREAHHWESFAAKHVSICEEISGLGNLIARWRERELRSWEDLLRCKEQEYVHKALQFWFTLSGVFTSVLDLENTDSVSVTESDEELVVGEVNALDINDRSSLDVTFNQTSEGSYSFHSWPALSLCTPSWMLVSPSNNRKLVAAAEVRIERQKINESVNEASPQQKLFESLDGFLKGAVVGEFPVRLHLVRLFALGIAQHCIRTKHVSSVLLSSAQVAMNMWKFYDQFLPAVRGFQEILKSPIQKRIKDEIKISKWDQLSSYGLMEHSEKIHRKLNKILREYQQDVLDYPVTSLLRKEAVGELAGENGDALQDGSLKKMPPLKAIFPFLAKAEPQTILIFSANDTALTEEACADDELADKEVTKSKRLRIKKKRKTKAVVKNTSSAMEGIDFGYCDVVVVDRAFSLVSSVRKTVDLTAPKLASLSMRYPRFGKVNILLPKVCKAMKSLLLLNREQTEDLDEKEDTTFGLRYVNKCRYGYLSHELAEDFCSDIFGQMAGLQGEEVTRNQKQRALKDLFDALKERVGVSSFHIDIPVQFRDASEMLTAPVPLASEIASDIFWNFSAPRDYLENAENYFMKNISEANELRTQTACEFTSDLSGREVHAMGGFAENLLMRSFNIRSGITAFLADIQYATNESTKLLDSLRAIEGYRIAREKVYNINLRATLTDSEQSNLIKTSLVYHKQLKEAWAYRRVGGGLLVNSLLELEKLTEPAIAALQLSDIVGCNADISSVFSDFHIAYDVASRVGKDLSALLDDLRLALCPVQTPSLSQAYLFHASDVFRYLPTADSELTGTSAEDVNASFDAIMESEILIVKCEKKMQSLTAILCKLLPLEVVMPIMAQFENFSAVVRQQREELETVSPSMHVNIHSEHKSDLSEAIAQAVQSGVDDCLLAVQRLQYLSFTEAGLDSSKRFIKSCFGDRTVTIPTFNKDEESYDIISCFELNTASASSLQLTRLAKFMSVLSSSLLDEQSNNTLNFNMLDTMHSTALLVSSIGLYSRILLEDMVRIYKSFSKMTYICLRIFRNLIAKGFCASSADSKVEEGEGQGDGTMMFQDDVEGTGMGEGDGKKDVSDEIENEEQLLGLKDEKNNEQNDPSTERKELDEKEKDTGVEMNQDFDGELFDIPDGEEEEKSNEDEEEDEEDLDREMDHGAEFSYDNIVDEQQWGSDDDEDEDNHGNKEGNKEMFEEGNAMDNETLEGEMRTKDEDESAQKKDQNNEKPEDKDNCSDEQNNDDEKGKINDEDEAETMEKPLGVDVRKPEEAKDNEDPSANNEGDADGGDEEPQDAAADAGFEDKMDTADPQDAGANDGKTEAPNDFDVDDMSIDDGGDDDSSKEPELSGDEDGDNDETMNEPDITSNGPAVQDGGEQDQELDLKEGNRKPKSQKSLSAAAYGVQASEGRDKMQKDDSNGEVDNDKNDAQVSAGQATGQGSSSSGLNDPQSAQDGADRDPSEPQDTSELPDETKDTSGGGDNDATGVSNADANAAGDGPPSSRHREPPNPFRKKGDLDKTWHERLNMKKQKQKEQGGGMDKISNKETGTSGESGGVFEYEMGDGEQDDDDTYGGDQVLAETVEGDAMKLQNSAAGGDNEETKANDKAEGKEEIDGYDAKDGEKTALAGENSSSKRERETEVCDETGNDGSIGDNNAGGEPDRKRAKTDSDANKEHNTNANNDPQTNQLIRDDATEDSLAVDESDEPINFPEEKSETAPDEPDLMDYGGRVLVGTSLTSFSAGDKEGTSYAVAVPDDDEYSAEVMPSPFEVKEITLMPTSPAAALWAHHKALGDEASMNLCEQLRLVLEPNLAARLKGDYRTGKRINMRRVISYVASGFRRDKIWLRRTKLAKRDYQVMIMLDDSCSMGAAGPLAMTSLAIISSALSRLEVGDLAVCSFSDHVNMLHSFGSPFNDDSGAGIAAELQFNASKTLLARSLDSVIPVFETARQVQMASVSGSGTVVQLCFVISDARLDTDNRERLNSVVRTMAERHILVVLIILDQNEDSKDSIFNTKSIEFTDDGIVTTSYLDNFPFPFYVAIQKLSALPNVLADSLKQWFEYVQYSLDSASN